MKRFSNILFIAHATTDDSAAFTQAVRLAQENQATLSVVTFVEEPAFYPSEWKKEIQTRWLDCRRERLDEFLRRSDSGDLAVNAKVLTGSSFLEVIREVLWSKHDLVIKSIESQDGAYSGFGSVDKKLLRKCPCPVWLIKETQQQRFRQILVGIARELGNTENDALNDQLLQMSVSLAIAESSELHIVHAWQLEHELFLNGPHSSFSSDEVVELLREEEAKSRAWLISTVANCLEGMGEGAADFVKPQCHLVKGRARIVIPKFARELGAELLVLGTVARTGIPGLVIGNTAEALLDRVDSSVLAVKPQGFEGPVSLK